MWNEIGRTREAQFDTEKRCPVTGQPFCRGHLGYAESTHPSPAPVGDQYSMFMLRFPHSWS